jgi:hypothetical protein
MPASGKDTDPTDYAETPSDDAPAESASNEQQDRLPVPKLLRKGPSPVKARTVLFEKMPSRVPGAYIHERPNREDNITTSTVMSIRKKLERKESTPRLALTPPIESGLPQLIRYPP